MNDPAKAAEAIIERISKYPAPGVASADAVLREAVLERTQMMETLLDVHHDRAGDRKPGIGIADREDLRWQIWPIVGKDAMLRDCHLDFRQPNRFRDEIRLTSVCHLRQNDVTHRRVRQQTTSPQDAP